MVENFEYNWVRQIAICWGNGTEENEQKKNNNTLFDNYSATDMALPVYADYDGNGCSVLSYHYTYKALQKSTRKCTGVWVFKIINYTFAFQIPIEQRKSTAYAWGECDTDGEGCGDI